MSDGGQESLVASAERGKQPASPGPAPAAAMDLMVVVREIDRKLRQLEAEYAAGAITKPDHDNRRAILRRKLRDLEAAVSRRSKEDPEWARGIRFRLYENRTVQFLLSGFLGGMLQELVPDFDADHRARYPILENINGVSATIDPTQILDDLSYAGILEKRLFERFASCPSCRTHSEVFLRFKCPECGSTELDSGSLIEHLVCGTVHEFEQCVSDDHLACPTCNEKLVEEGNDYRTVGTFSKCNSCRVHFEGPVQKFACRKCNKEFNPYEASFYETYTYTLKKEVLPEAKSLVGLPLFKSSLEANGYRVEFPGTVTGSSGILHSFTFTAMKDSKTWAVDLIESDAEVDEKEVLAFYAKVTDAKSAKGILVAVPGLSKRAREFASSALSKEAAKYVESKSIAEAADALRLALESDRVN